MNWAQFLLLLMSVDSVVAAAAIYVLDYLDSRRLRPMAIDLRVLPVSSTRVFCEPDMSGWKPQGGA
jgi:hypothetical protein